MRAPLWPVHYFGCPIANRLPIAERAVYAERAKIGARVGAVHEKDCPGGICLCINRREDQGTWGLAREDESRKCAKSYTRRTLRSSKSGSGWGLPSGPTAASSARERRTRTPSR